MLDDNKLELSPSEDRALSLFLDLLERLPRLQSLSIVRQADGHSFKAALEMRGRHDHEMVHSATFTIKPPADMRNQLWRYDGGIAS